MERNLLIEKIIRQYLDNNSGFKHEEDKLRLYSKFMDDVKSEIISMEKDSMQQYKDKLIEEGLEEKQKLLDEGNKELEKSKAMYAIEKAKNLFRDGIIVAFIVGILVNQCTDLITPTKQVLSKKFNVHSIVISTVIVVILIFIIDRIMKKYYFDKMKEYLFNKDK